VVLIREKNSLYYGINKGGKCFMNNKLVKVIGLAASVVGVVASVATNWANEKKLDDKIAGKVSEALANLKNED
jgi:hypothetical protein